MAGKKNKAANQESEEAEDKQQFYPDAEQGIKANPKSSEEVADEMEEGNKEEDVYSEEGREKLEEEEGIEPFEEGFMEGESGEGSLGACAHCGKPLGDREEVVERKIKGKEVFFCSEKCASGGSAGKA